MSHFLLPTVMPDQMFAHLASATRRVVMLDFDGTLAPFAVERNQAVAHPGVFESIDRLMQRVDTRVVLITGRSIVDFLPLLGLSEIPEIRGSHGWELRDTEGTLSVADAGVAIEGLHEATAIAIELGLEDRLERKPVSLALHWRGMDSERVAGVAAKVRHAWEAVASEKGMKVHSFDGGIELRVPGRDKGTAVEEVLSVEPPDAFAIYLGDDISDEDAFHEFVTVAMESWCVRNYVPQKHNCGRNHRGEC